MRTKNLFNKLVSLMEYIDGQNNYEITHIVVSMYREGIEIYTFCMNEYGGIALNRDDQFIYWENIPNWVMRKLRVLHADSCSINESNNIKILD